MALLTLTQQNGFKPISQNWANEIKIAGGVTNFEQLEIEVENNELKKLLGAALLYDIQQNPTDPENVILLDGDTFEDCNGNDIEFKGIRYQLAFMIYAEYLPISKNAQTFTGLVQQNRTETTPADPGSVKKEQQRAREIALQDFELMKQYINGNTDDYPTWINGETAKIYAPKLTTIRKTYN